jgi:transposase
MLDGTIEIITGKERRRRWSLEEKLRIVAEAEEPGARITEVAGRHEVYPSLLFNWRRQMREGRLRPDPTPDFVPIYSATMRISGARQL